MLTKRAPISLKQRKKNGGGFAARFRHLELAVSATTVIDLKPFLVATLRKCIAGFICAEEKGEEIFCLLILDLNYDLSQRGGERARFKYVLKQPEGWV